MRHPFWLQGSCLQSRFRRFESRGVACAALSVCPESRTCGLQHACLGFFLGNKKISCAFAFCFLLTSMVMSFKLQAALSFKVLEPDVFGGDERPYFWPRGRAACRRPRGCAQPPQRCGWRACDAACDAACWARSWRGGEPLHRAGTDASGRCRTRGVGDHQRLGPRLRLCHGAGAQEGRRPVFPKATLSLRQGMRRMGGSGAFRGACVAAAPLRGWGVAPCGSGARGGLSRLSSSALGSS